MSSPFSHGPQPHRTEAIDHVDPEDKIFDSTGDIDWEEILATTEPDRLAGRLIPFEEFIRRSLEDADAIGRMTPVELDALLAAACSDQECIRMGA